MESYLVDQVTGELFVQRTYENIDGLFVYNTSGGIDYRFWNGGGYEPNVQSFDVDDLGHLHVLYTDGTLTEYNGNGSLDFTFSDVESYANLSFNSPGTPASSIVFLGLDGSLQYVSSNSSTAVTLDTGVQSFAVDGLGGLVYLKGESLYFATTENAGSVAGSTPITQCQIAANVQSYTVDGLGGVFYLQGQTLSYWTAHGSAIFDVYSTSNNGIYGYTVDTGVRSFVSDGLGGVLITTTSGDLYYWTAHPSAIPGFYGLYDGVGLSQVSTPDGSPVVAVVADGLGGVLITTTSGDLYYWTAHPSAAPGFLSRRKYRHRLLHCEPP